MTEDTVAASCAAAMYAADKASRHLGIEVAVTAAGAAEASMTVTAEMLNGFAVCHGGHIFALADTAFAFACNGYDDVTVAASAAIDFIRPGRLDDRLTAVAREQRRGRNSGIYDVTVRNQRGEDVALFRGRAVATGEALLPGARGRRDRAQSDT